jgi:hypothetical protein
MFSINESFIGYVNNQRYQPFSGSDTVELFAKNLKNKPNDWYYRTAKINYTRNDVGHRCKNIDEINLENYILFVGCSHTEGIGLELEKSYPYRTSQNLDCDYYNLAIGGSGIDVAIHNLTIWFNKIQKRPKHLIFQIPSLHRFCSTLSPATDVPAVGMYNIHSKNKNVSDFILTGEAFNYWNSLYELSIVKVKSLGVPYTEILIEPNHDLTYNQIELVALDEARDGHYGIESHTTLAEKITERINQCTL